MAAAPVTATPVASCLGSEGLEPSAALRSRGPAGGHNLSPRRAALVALFFLYSSVLLS